MTTRNSNGILVLGRAMHPPWNEGTRMIARGLADAAGELRSTRIISLTHPSFAPETDGRPRIEHVAARGSYGPFSDWLALPRIMKRGRRAAADCDAGVAHIVGLPLALAPTLRARGPRVVAHVTMTEHAYANRTDRVRAAAGWRLFDHWIDAYAASSSSVRESLAEQGVNERKLHLVPPPIPLETFRAIDKAAARAALGIAPETFSVIYMGTVSPLRFPAEMVIAALDRAARRTPSLRLDVFAPVRTHEYNVVFAGGHVAAAAQGAAVPLHIHLEDLADDRKATVFSAADLVILPFAAAVAVEPPLTLLEAMACEAVVAVAPAANRSGLVRHGETGLAFDDARSLAACIEVAAEHGRAGRRVLGVNARREVAARHGTARIAQALADVWTALGR